VAWRRVHSSDIHNKEKKTHCFCCYFAIGCGGRGRGRPGRRVWVAPGAVKEVGRWGGRGWCGSHHDRGRRGWVRVVVVGWVRMMVGGHDPQECMGWVSGNCGRVKGGCAWVAWERGGVVMLAGLQV
jgi:hypothetical protein